jgi:hypothetical protein
MHPLTSKLTNTFSTSVAFLSSRHPRKTGFLLRGEFSENPDMNEREFFTEALLSSHSVLMPELMPVSLVDDDELAAVQVMPAAEKTARLAALTRRSLLFGGGHAWNSVKRWLLLRLGI